jgi:hypothetical protein
MPVTNASAKWLVDEKSPQLAGCILRRLDTTLIEGMTFPRLVVYNPKDEHEYGWVIAEDEELNGPGWVELDYAETTF